MTQPRLVDRGRRRLLQAGGALCGWWALGAAGVRAADDGTRVPYAGLLPPDVHGLRLLPGYRARVVARSGLTPAPHLSMPWHAAPDGGACLATTDGGWIYLSNSELDRGRGGVSALRFASDGTLLDAYPVLRGGDRNCAGGMTPWGTYLSCEEVPQGRVWECDPYGREAGVVRSALGRFNHESLAIDTETLEIYLTEDEPDGRFYRYRPAAVDAGGRADLEHGELMVAERAEGHLRWHRVPDPSARRGATRRQVAASSAFRGGEGICYLRDHVYFVTKGDDRVWRYHTRTQALDLLYDVARVPRPFLRGLDNLVVSPSGELFVSEDGDDMQIVALSLDGSARPVAQLRGHPRSEVTGLAFSPDGRRLYFSSQRGRKGRARDGMTFEIRGPAF